MSGKTRSVILLLGGLVVGFGIAELANREQRISSPSTDTLDPVPQEDPNADELLRLRATVANQAERIARLEKELAAAQAVTIDTTEATEPAEDPREAFARRMQDRIERRVDSRVADMAERFGLTEQQQTALKDILLKRMTDFRSRWTGGGGEGFNLDEAIASVLTADQFAQYLQESQQEIYNRAELVATNQTVRLSQAVPLTPELESMVYETFNLTAQEMMIAGQEGVEFDMRAVLEERLGSLLTEEQMQAYRDAFARGGPGRGMGPGGGGLIGP